ncbi:hypothetical protein D3C87_1709460 [compost metagenome]
MIERSARKRDECRLRAHNKTGDGADRAVATNNSNAFAIFNWCFKSRLKMFFNWNRARNSDAVSVKYISQLL